MAILCTIIWGDVATWFTGIITLGALVFAYYQLYSDRQISKNADFLDQAEHVSAWIENETGSKATVVMLNESKSPVYKVVIKLVRAGNEITDHIDMELLGYVSFISILPPGKYLTYIDNDYHGMSFTPAIEISFTDSKGLHWVRGGNGNIRRLKKTPTEYYGLGEPMPWQLPREKQFL